MLSILCVVYKNYVNFRNDDEMWNFCSLNVVMVIEWRYVAAMAKECKICANACETKPK